MNKRQTSYEVVMAVAKSHVAHANTTVWMCLGRLFLLRHLGYFILRCNANNSNNNDDDNEKKATIQSHNNNLKFPTLI